MILYERLNQFKRVIRCPKFKLIKVNRNLSSKPMVNPPWLNDESNIHLEEK